MVVELMCRSRATVFNDCRRLLETQLRFLSNRYSDFMYNSEPTFSQIVLYSVGIVWRPHQTIFHL